MLAESCYHFVPSANQNRDAADTVFNVKVNDAIMNFRIFIITLDGGNDGGLPSSLLDGSNVDGGDNWSESAGIRRYRLVDNVDRYTDMRVFESDFFGRNDFSFRLTSIWSGSLIVCDLPSEFTCEAAPTTTSVAVTTTPEATTTTGWFCEIVPKIFESGYK